jgi:hypothetical protein
VEKDKQIKERRKRKADADDTLKTGPSISGIIRYAVWIRNTENATTHASASGLKNDDVHGFRRVSVSSSSSFASRERRLCSLPAGTLDVEAGPPALPVEPAEFRPGLVNGLGTRYDASNRRRRSWQSGQDQSAAPRRSVEIVGETLLLMYTALR